MDCSFTRCDYGYIECYNEGYEAGLRDSSANIDNLKRKIDCTTDTWEACAQGYAAGWDAGYESGFVARYGTPGIETKQESNVNKTIINWNEVKKGTMVNVRYRYEEYPNTFEAPFIAFYDGFVILDVLDVEHDSDLIYDGFSPYICSIK